MVITGLGAAAPNGIGREAFWEALVAGRSGIGLITRFDCSELPVKIGGQVDEIDYSSYIKNCKISRMKRFARLAVVAAKMAVEDAGISLNPVTALRTGACFGSTIAGFPAEREFSAFVKRGFRGINPTAWVDANPHAATSYVAIELGITGPVITICSGCSTGLDTIGSGFHMIRENRADTVVCGASDTPLTPLAFSAMCASGILSTYGGDPAKASRPFARGRDGIVLSEGAASVILEELETALGRGAEIYAEVLGFSSNSEAGEMVYTDPAGCAISRAMESVLAQSMLLPEDIDYIHAHGSGFPDGDLADTNAIKKTFGSMAYSIPVSTIRSMTGQALAASGVLQAVSTALTLRSGIVPPTVNCEEPDELCDLDYVTEGARRVRVRRAVLNSTSVGGTHGVLLLGRPDCSGRQTGG